MAKRIDGFSKLKKQEKRNLVSSDLHDPSSFLREWEKMERPDAATQTIIDNLSENCLSNFILPFSIAPNFSINGRVYHFPMVTEESSVVAAAASAAGFWSMHGGFHTKVLNTIKSGQIHFLWKADKKILFGEMEKIEKELLLGIQHLTKKMHERGGGITGMELLDFTSEMDSLFQLRVFFETADAMGANFINSCLEEMAIIFTRHFDNNDLVEKEAIEIIMSILSNYTPECLVSAEVNCNWEQLGGFGMDGKKFAERFKTAVDIAALDPFRAVTHNKGILNGSVALLLATGNDFRAAEASAHAYASRDGKYRSLSYVTLHDGIFTFGLRMPMPVGTVGGITNSHPLCRQSLRILDNPDAGLLMQMVAAAGLASNFSAIRALISTGIQHGHMRMHLSNILIELKANQRESSKIREFFQDKTVSYSSVEDYLNKIRSGI